MSVLTGSIRAADKLCRAKAVDTDICQWCQEGRQTAHHLWWECLHFECARAPFLRKHNDLRDKVHREHPRHLPELDCIIDVAAWRCCGLVAETSRAVPNYVDAMSQHRGVGVTPP